MIRQHSKKNRMSQLFDLFDANEDSVSSDDDNAFDRKGKSVKVGGAYHSSNDSVDSSVTDSEANEHNVREVPRAKNSSEKMQTSAKTLPIGSIAENGMNTRQPSPVFPPRSMIRRHESVLDIPEGETFHLPHDNELRSVGVGSADTSDDDSSDDDNSNRKNQYDHEEGESDVVRETDDSQIAFQKRNRQRRKLLAEIASKETTAVTIWRTIAYCVLIFASIFFVVGTTMNSRWHSQRISTESYEIVVHELRELLLARVRATRLGIVSLADEIALTGETEGMGTTGSSGTTTSATNHHLRRMSVRQQNRSTNLRSNDDVPQNQQQYRRTKNLQQRVSYLWNTYLFPSTSLSSNVSLTTNTRTTSTSNEEANENNTKQKGFPFVTFNFFESHVLEVFESSRRTVEMMSWIPLIEPNQSDMWIEYSQQNLDKWYHQTTSMGSEGENNNITIVDSIWEYGDTMQAFYEEVSKLNSSMNNYITQGDNTSLSATHLLTTQSPQKALHFNFSYYAPIWQTFPRPSSVFNHTSNEITPTNNDVKLLKAVNFDMMSVPTFASIANEFSSSLVSQTQFNEGLFSPVDPYYGSFINKNLDDTEGKHQQSHDTVLDEGYHFYDMYALDSSINENRNELSSLFRPHSLLLQPVLVSAPREADNSTHTQTNHYDDNERRVLVGFLASIISWDSFFVDLVPHKTSGIYLVLKNTCGQAYTYLQQYDKVQYIGEGDFHDTDYDATEEIISVPNNHEIAPKMLNHSTYCLYTFHVYSSGEYIGLAQSHETKNFVIVISIVVLLFVVSFTMYDKVVNRRNIIVVNAALRANQLVSSVFPSHIRQKLLAEPDNSERDNARSLPSHMILGNTTGKQRRRQSIGFGESNSSLGFGHDLDGDDDDDEMTVLFSSKPPIADLFPETTILFADIAGFTNWSSAREPTQVFTLLETLYHAFDEIAKKRRIYKVETVGDCYVAVAGLPEPRKDHAMAMCRFAKDIVLKMRHLTIALQRRLGPETEDLALRAGLHSGPVTAGVLRGQNSRFQLFGDTMNTAARMEQTGERNKIQLSRETADLVVAGGKPKWISPRADKVFAKGKGELETFWLLLRLSDGDGRSISLSATSETSSRRTERDFTDSFAMSGVHDKSSSLIDWNVDILSRLLKQIMARRNATPKISGDTTPDENRYVRNAIRPFDEVCEIITLPKFDAKIIMNQVDPETIELDEVVLIQLHSIVSVISSTYRDNPFHNFEHASHVTLSVVKLLSRIVAPNSVKGEELDEEGNRTYSADALHDQTYGITSDPLTQFACVFSALIHDCDHPGVPNAQLVNENTAAAIHYKNQSIAEQNSVDMVWKILMSDEYRELRNAIYSTDQELLHFRRLVVNCVMATDIVDKELKALRNSRWERAFNEVEEEFATYRKATIVIEHLIQASDVAHTMQHWETYRRWNERFFMECYKAYHDGRAEKNPIDGWYQGEIGFFDFYIIPLAKKLNDCGVFGVSSAEYLGYAMKNRDEWVARGQEIVGEMAEKVKTTMPNYTDDEFETSKCLLESSEVCNKPGLTSTTVDVVKDTDKSASVQSSMPNYTDNEFETSKCIKESSVVCSKPNLTSTIVNVVKDTDESASVHPCDDDDDDDDDDDHQRIVPISKILKDHKSCSTDVDETTSGNNIFDSHNDVDTDDADCTPGVESVTNFFFM